MKQKYQKLSYRRYRSFLPLVEVVVAVPILHRQLIIMIHQQIIILHYLILINQKI